MQLIKNRISYNINLQDLRQPKIGAFYGKFQGFLDLDEGDVCTLKDDIINYNIKIDQKIPGKVNYYIFTTATDLSTVINSYYFLNVQAKSILDYILGSYKINELEAASIKSINTKLSSLCNYSIMQGSKKDNLINLLGLLKLSYQDCGDGIIIRDYSVTKDVSVKLSKLQKEIISSSYSSFSVPYTSENINLIKEINYDYRITQKSVIIYK